MLHLNKAVNKNLPKTTFQNCLWFSRSTHKFEYTVNNEISLLKKIGKLHFFFVGVYFTEAGFMHHLIGAPCNNMKQKPNPKFLTVFRQF